MTITERLKSYEPLWENWYFDGYLSSGASGTVYKFKQNRFGKYAFSAVKVISLSCDNQLNLHKRKSFMDDIRKRAESEIENMYLLNDCPYIVHCNNHAIKDVTNASGNIIAVDILIQMDLYTCLVNYLAEYEELYENEVIKLAEQIGLALKAAHDRGIIHRDIKPSNIFINDNGDFLLGDLGVSKRFNVDCFLTKTGTEPYIAPEIWKGDGTNAYTTTADIYSLGIVLYMLMNDNYLPLVDENSSLSETSKAIIDRIMGKNFEVPKHGCEEFKKIIMKSCAYNTAERYSDINDFLADVKAAYAAFTDTLNSWEIREDGTLIINKFIDNNYKECISDVSHLVISEGIKEIPQNAFKGFQFKEVRLPHSLEVINSGAFEMCKMLNDIKFEKCSNLKRIGKKAFSMCISVESIDFSICKSLCLIEDRAFWYCKSLKNVILPDSSITDVCKTAFKDSNYYVTENT